MPVLLRYGLENPDLDIVVPLNGNQFSGIKPFEAQDVGTDWNEAFWRRGEYDMFPLHAKFSYPVIKSGFNSHSQIV